jgi:large subunit ribosomal protein L25
LTAVKTKILRNEISSIESVSADAGATRAEVKKLRDGGSRARDNLWPQAKPQNLEVNAREFTDLLHHSVPKICWWICRWKAMPAPSASPSFRKSSIIPLDGKVLHVDFHEISPDENVTVQCAVETSGEAAGVKTGGGVLEHVLFKLKVRCLPRDLPEQILVDVSSLEIGQSVHLGDIKAPEGVEILGDKHISVIAVARLARKKEVASPPRRRGAGDVEMTKEKKEEGEEGAAPAKARPKGAKAGDKKPKPSRKAKAEKKK